MIRRVEESKNRSIGTAWATSAHRLFDSSIPKNVLHHAVSPFLPHPQVRIFGVPIWNPEYEEFKRWWNSQLTRRTGTALLGIANAHTLNLAHKDKRFARMLHAFDALINDGTGARMAAKMRKRPFSYNFNGTDLFPRLFAEHKGRLTVFLYGGTEASNKGAAERIEREWPNICVVGRVDGYGSEAEAIKAIQDAAPDLLLVALGQPHQERFLIRNQNVLNAKIACGVGALFDFLSGSAQRAPVAFRRAGMEWAYRLALEPKRLFKRYVMGNPRFLVHAMMWRTRDTRG